MHSYVNSLDFDVGVCMIRATWINTLTENNHARDLLTGAD